MEVGAVVLEVGAEAELRLRLLLSMSLHTGVTAILFGLGYTISTQLHD